MSGRYGERAENLRKHYEAITDETVRQEIRNTLDILGLTIEGINDFLSEHQFSQVWFDEED